MKLGEIFSYSWFRTLTLNLNRALLLCSMKMGPSRRVFGSRLKLNEEEGSAAVEFVILAIPLFLPILIFLGQFSDLSRSEIQSRNLIREIVRAYVSSPNSSRAESNARAVLQIGQERLSFTKSEITSMHLSFICSARPCLSPGERVRGELTLTPNGSNRTVKVSAQQYVSPWQ